MRTAKEKRYGALDANIKIIKNCKKTKDFNQMLSSFEDLQKNFDKAKPIIAKEENGVTPRFFLRILVEIEDLVNETWEDAAGRKNLSKVNGKSLGALRQKLRKYIRENHEEGVAKFRENPDADDDEPEDAAEDAGSDDDSDADIRAKSVEKEMKPSKSRKRADDDEDDDSDAMWPSDTESSSSSDDDIVTATTYTREMFLKKAVDPEKEKKKKEKEEKKRRDREKRREEMRVMQQQEQSDESDGEGGWTVQSKSSAKVAMFPKDAEITNELVINKLAEIMAARGKKKTNRKEQIELLNELSTIGKIYINLELFLK